MIFLIYGHRVLRNSLNLPTILIHYIIPSNLNWFTLKAASMFWTLLSFYKTALFQQIFIIMLYVMRRKWRSCRQEYTMFVELQITHGDKFRHLIRSLANKPSLPIADVLVRKEKDCSYSTIIVEENHPAHFHYSKTLEKITFKARYGHFNRNGIPQHTLF